MTFRVSVERNEDALCWKCTNLDYDPIYSIATGIIYPLPFCPKKEMVIHKGFKNCLSFSYLTNKEDNE